MVRGLLVAVAFSCLAGCSRGPHAPETDPPSVPLTPAVERLELGRFRLAWEHAEDDRTPTAELRYEIGLVRGQYCVVPEADYVVVGDDSLTIEALHGTGDNPFVGFTLRSIDDEGQSHGYGRCGWALRAPQRSPIPFAGRTPLFDFANGDCQSDGSEGMWCAGNGELAHFGGTGWDVFPLPTTVELVDWVAIGETEALARVGSVQLQISRANGLHAYVISPSSQPFDSSGGTIRTGLERAYLSVRGMVGEFTSGHIDLAGPARALRLPDACEGVLQMGHRGDLAFAHCRSATGNNVFLGRPERRLMSWAEPFAVGAGRVAGISGDLDRGLLALVDSSAVTIYRWSAGEIEELVFQSDAGTTPPFAVVGGHAQSPLVLFGTPSAMSVFKGEVPERIPVEGENLVWLETRVPLNSTFIGTSNGLLAVSERGVARLTSWGAEWLAESTEIVRGARGLDGRHYILQGPRLDAIASTLAGHAYHYHTWRGPQMEPVDLAVSASGAMYVSGWATNETGERRATISKLGSQTNVMGLGNHPFFERPPTLALDTLGRLYASDGHVVASFSPALSEWTTYSGAPTLDIEWMVGLSTSLVIIARHDGEPTRVDCFDGACTERPLPEAGGHVTTAFAQEGELYLGLSGLGLWRQNGDQTVPLRFSTDIISHFPLSRGGDWEVVDAIPFGEGKWLVAISAAGDGFLASVSDEEGARLLGYGFEWGSGHILVPTSNDHTIVALEVDGPVGIRLRGERVSIPGRLY